ncbi:hypothetical protein [Micromonospora sp. DT229]|uniref:hypothetical protein n=1 Tax=Micromonospora sp. DT229 TaxID=3393430 RepID=UPI003CF9DA0A
MIEIDGRRYGIAAQIAAALGTDVTTEMVRNWRRRDGLQAIRVGRNVYSPLDQAAAIERDKRCSGRGRRRVDVGPPAAA